MTLYLSRGQRLGNSELSLQLNRLLQQCHSAGSLHLSSSEIRRTLEQNLSFKSELLIPKVSTDAIHLTYLSLCFHVTMFLPIA